MDPTIAVAAVGGVCTIIAALVAARTATNAEKLKRQGDDNRSALDGFKDLTAEHKADIARLRAELAEERAVNDALTKQNEAMHAELLKLRRSK